MEGASERRLIRVALKARQRAVAPYSRFKVGAAILTRNGKVFGGANVESASYGLTCCAERVALFKALTEGCRDLVAIAVVARVSEGPTPCGACLQLLAEYAPGATLLVADSGRLSHIKRFAINDLLPKAFRLSSQDND
jgi:cytidine deaminase